MALIISTSLLASPSSWAQNSLPTKKKTIQQIQLDNPQTKAIRQMMSSQSSQSNTTGPAAQKLQASYDKIKGSLPQYKFLNETTTVDSLPEETRRKLLEGFKAISPYAYLIEHIEDCHAAEQECAIEVAESSNENFRAFQQEGIDASAIDACVQQKGLQCGSICGSGRLPFRGDYPYSGFYFPIACSGSKVKLDTSQCHPDTTFPYQTALSYGRDTVYFCQSNKPWSLKYTGMHQGGNNNSHACNVAGMWLMNSEITLSGDSACIPFEGKQLCLTKIKETESASCEMTYEMR